LCERRNENAPGVESEGIRGSSEDRGDRSPGKGVDQGLERSPSYANRAHRPASRFGSDGIRRSAMWFGINMIEGWFNSKERSRVSARPRTLLARATTCKRNF